VFGHFWVVELTYRYVFSFKFTLTCKQSDIVQLFNTGVVDALTPVVNLTPVSLIPVVHDSIVIFFQRLGKDDS
jgi:hypothetical protein